MNKTTGTNQHTNITGKNDSGDLKTPRRSHPNIAYISEVNEHGAAKTAVKPRKAGRYIAAFFSGLVKTIQFLASIAGVLLLVYLILQLKVFASKFQTIMELQGIIGNLKSSAPVVRLQLIEAKTEPASPFGSKIKKRGIKTFKVAYFNASGEVEEFETNTVSIPGENIYVDCEVYNFTYSLIEKGEAQNIAVPYRIYSDVIPPEDGILLNAKNERGIPYALLQTSKLGSEEFYETEHARLTKLMNIINNPVQAKELGIIRSLQKAAVANYASMQVGSTYTVVVENTGGLILKK